MGTHAPEQVIAARGNLWKALSCTRSGSKRTDTERAGSYVYASRHRDHDDD